MSTKSRIALGIYAPALIIGLGTWIATALGTWAWLSGSDYVPDFSDLKQITATAGCVSADPTWSLASDTCDPNGRAYNYPAIWARSFAALGWTLEDTYWIGIALGILLVIALAGLGYLLRSAWGASWKPLSIWLLAACSPPFWLALDRGNSDIIVFAVVILAVALVIAELHVIPSVVVTIAGVLKFFTLGRGLMVVAMRRGRWWATLTWVIGSLLAVAVLWQDLPLISARTPRSDWMSFGVSVVPIRFQEFLGPWEGNGRVIGLIAATFFVLGVWVVILLERLEAVRASRDALLNAFVTDRRAAAILLAGCGTFLMAYLVGTGYDYRLMFLILVVGGFLLVGRWTFAATFSVLMWCSGHWFLLGEPRISPGWRWPLPCRCWSYALRCACCGRTKCRSRTGECFGAVAEYGGSSSVNIGLCTTPAWFSRGVHLEWVQHGYSTCYRR